MTSLEESETDVSSSERGSDCGSERSSERGVLLCRLGVITEESLISGV